MTEQDLTGRFLNYDPDTRQPWRGLMTENTPDALPIGVPAFIAQGSADTPVLPQVTADYARALCRGDRAVSFLTVPGVDHGLIAEKSAPQVVSWMAGRFKGDRAPGNCGK